MLDPANYPFCSEFYIVEKSIEVVAKINGENRQIRIDALRGPDSTARYSTGFLHQGRHHCAAYVPPNQWRLRP